jgi:hypothetical protein
VADVQLVERARKGLGLVLRQDETQAVRALLALFSAAAAAIHFSVAGEHLSVWWLHGMFFVAVAWAQALFAVLLLVRPTPLILKAGIAGNAAVIVTWAISRTVGIPIGPTAGLPEIAGLEDVTATVFQVILVSGCYALLRGWVPARRLSLPVVGGGLLLAGAAVAFTSGALVSAATGGHHEMPGGEQMTGIAHAEMAGGSGGHHSGSPISADDPVVRQLSASLQSGGTIAALDKLESLSSQNEATLTLAHQYVHELGRMVYESYPDASEAFSSCDQRFESGCYHGVLQGYFEEHPNFTGRDISGLCQGVAGSNTNLNFQCLHGLGHGLTLFFNHNLLRPLRYCDFLADTWQQASCYGGVFMENIVWSQSPESDRSQSPGETVIDEDPHYPCNSVAEKYRWDCYAMQSSVILYLNGWDIEEAFVECDNAEEAYISACYYSMGRDVAGYTQHDPVASRQLCMLSQPPNRTWCFDGAARTLVNLEGTTEGAFELCRHAPSDSKERCYRAIGEMALAQSSESGYIEQACAEALEPLGETMCLRSAGEVA